MFGTATEEDSDDEEDDLQGHSHVENVLMGTSDFRAATETKNEVIPPEIGQPTDHSSMQP